MSNVTFSEKLKTVMQDLGLNQARLCEMTGRSKGSVCQYLSGKQIPTEETMKDMAVSLGLDPEYFLQKEKKAAIPRKNMEVPTIPRLDVETAAQMLGINTKVAFTVAFVLSVVLAGLAGLLLTPIYTIYPSVGSVLKTTALMIVVLGGMGSIPGALVGGLLVGVVEALVGTLISSNLGPAGIFVVFLIVLYARPQGLFGKKGRVA